MEWKTIRNAGYVGSQTDLPKNQKFARAAKFLEEVVKEFARASYRYCELTNELPFIYRERQIHTVLLPAIAKIADASLAEMPITRERGLRFHQGQPGRPRAKLEGHLASPPETSTASSI